MAGAAADSAVMSLGSSDTDLADLDGPEDLVRRLLEVARTRTEMDMVWVSRIKGDVLSLAIVNGALGDSTILEGSTIPLKDSFCAQVIGGRIASWVPDVRALPETRDLPMAAQLGIRAFVSVPIKAATGSVIGMLTAVSTDPRDVDERTRDFLQMLADSASDLLRDVPIDGDDRRRLRDRIGRVIDHDLLTIAFQPIVDLEHRRVAGYEALSRFPGEPARPDQWFADAAAVGLGVALELHAARTAVSALANLPPDTYLSINLSPAALVSVDPSELVPADPTRLVLELTEHARVGDYEQLRHALDRFRGAGVRIAVDDAGAGFASFRHILELEPDIVKVDLAISQGIHRDPARQALVGGISELARHSGATLVAEGVEEPADLDRLATLGVSIFQGYLFGRPAPLPSNGLPEAAIPAHSIGTPAHRSPRVMESRFETAVLSAAVPTAIVDLDGTMRSVSDRFAAFLGRTTAEMTGRRFQELTHPEDLDADVEHLRACLEGRADGYRMTKRYLRPDGSPVSADLIATVVRDRDGAPLYFVSHVLPL